MVVKLLHGSLLGVIVATPLQGECEDEIHTLKVGTWSPPGLLQL
jgi:hypothetical protein